MTPILTRRRFRCSLFPVSAKKALMRGGSRNVAMASDAPKAAFERVFCVPMVGHSGGLTPAVLPCSRSTNPLMPDHPFGSVWSGFLKQGSLAMTHHVRDRAIARPISTCFTESFDPLALYRRPIRRRKLARPKKPSRHELEVLLQAIFAEAVPVASEPNATAFLLVLNGQLLDIVAGLDAAREEMEEDDPPEDNGDREPWLAARTWVGVGGESLSGADDDRELDECDLEDGGDDEPDEAV